MTRNNKIARLMLLVMAAVLMMTTIALASGNDVVDIVKKGGTWVSELMSTVVTIGTFYVVAKLSIKQNWLVMITTLVLGLGVAYIIRNPDLATSIIGNSMQSIVG